MPSEYIILDLETTGIDVLREVPVQSFLGVFSENAEWLFAEELIWRASADRVAMTHHIHRISPRRSGQGLPAATALRQICGSLLRLQHIYPDAPLVAYNASFDLSMLLVVAQRELSRRAYRSFRAALESFPVLDPLVLDRALDPFRKGKRNLSAVAEYYSISPELISNAHDASIDCEITGRVLLEIVEKFHLEKETLAALHKKQIAWHKGQNERLAAYFGSDPSEQAGWPIRTEALKVLDVEPERSSRERRKYADLA